MASLCQPVTTSVTRAGECLAVSSQSPKRRTPSVASARYTRDEAARLCSSATLSVSPFWSMHSRRALLAKTTTPLPVAVSTPIVEARLFGPALFEAAKLKVLFLGADKGHPDELPRIYTLTHSDITSKITLAISREINKAQLKGWYSRLQRDEVVAEWKRVQGKMSLHVHCHISGGNFFHNLIANLLKAGVVRWMQILTTPWCGCTSIPMSRSTTVWNAGAPLLKLQEPLRSRQSFSSSSYSSQRCFRYQLSFHLSTLTLPLLSKVIDSAPPHSLQCNGIASIW